MTFDLPKPKLSRWARLHERVEARFPVFEVQRLTLVPPRSSPRDFFTLGCRDWCNVIALTDADEVIFVWQYRFGTDDLSLETPGGVIDPSEAPEAAARRELLEETGYEAEGFELLSTCFPNPAFQGNVCHSFVAWRARPVAAPSFDDAEECELALVPRRHLADLLDAGAIGHGLIALGIERFLRRHP